MVAALVLAAAPTLADPGEKTPLPRLTEARVGSLRGFLERNARAPAEYVTGEFRDHDVVILGERHYTKHQVEFVQSLIPRLHGAGIRHLATEFARREDQPLVDSLLSGGVWDEGLAREITFRQHVHWGFREYVDVFKAAWELNAALPNGEPRFRIVAMNDSPDWSLVRTPGDAADEAVKRRVWRGGGEHLWARAVLDVVEAGNRVLVYCGMHHAFSRFKQPIFDGSGAVINYETRRAGNHLRAELGDRVVTVCLHHPWDESPGGGGLTYPADGVIDALMAELGAAYYPAGFDTRGTPFGALSCESSIYGAGYEHLTLAQFCDGYIFFKPLSEHEGVTVIGDFVNDGNIDRARVQAPNPKYRDASPVQFYASAYRAANLTHRYRRLK
jgi:hypothetical protein